jgi:hypothetical protein
MKKGNKYFAEKIVKRAGTSESRPGKINQGLLVSENGGWDSKCLELCIMFVQLIAQTKAKKVGCMESLTVFFLLVDS